MRRVLIAVLALFPATAIAETVLGQPVGWRIVETPKTYGELLADLRDAVRVEEMGLVTEAGPTETAASRGETIPGNRVIGVFRNDFAVSIIRVAPAAMIEAPVRMMVMEEPDGTATIAWKTAATAFAPYMEEGGDTLREVAGALDGILESIAGRAAAETAAE